MTFLFFFHTQNMGRYYVPLPVIFRLLHHRNFKEYIFFLRTDLYLPWCFSFSSRCCVTVLKSDLNPLSYISVHQDFKYLRQSYFLFLSLFVPPPLYRYHVFQRAPLRASHKGWAQQSGGRRRRREDESRRRIFWFFSEWWRRHKGGRSTAVLFACVQPGTALPL